jgi:P pilus assembly chaperone PapD
VKYLHIVAASLLCSISSVPAAAQRIAPMLYDLSPTGEGSTKVLRLDNNLTRPITIETAVYRREIAADGTEKRVEAGDDFLVFPPQAIIQPNATQAFRVRYVGEPNLNSTSMYVVSFNQVPLPSSEVRSLQFVVNFGTAAYVTPAGLRPEISVASTQASADGKSLAVTVNNNGGRYASLALSQFTVTNGNGQSFSLEGEPLRAALGLTVVPAGGKRIFNLPVAAGFNATGPLKTAIKYDPTATAQ